MAALPAPDSNHRNTRPRRTARVLAVGAAALTLTLAGAALAPGPSPVLFWSVLGGGGAPAAGLVVLLVRRRGRGTPPANLPPTQFPGPCYGPISAQPSPRAEKVLVPPSQVPAWALWPRPSTSGR